jgi:hypothetical protein
MPVILNTPIIPAVPEYDKVHLEHLIVTLEKTNYAKTQITAKLRPYYQDSNGNKIFSTDAVDILIEDAEQWITQLALQGDMRGVEANDHIKAIVAFLVETKTNFGTTTIS